KMTDKPKIVFTGILEKSEWDNTKLAKGNITDEIAELKKEAGKDIIAYGGANFISNLIKHDLIDEYHFFVNPVVIANGMSIFKSLKDRLKLKLIKTTTSSTGIVILYYQPEK
ncbi:MAG: dihydrofolate reductase family protein, partial [Bacteroidota bacterium]|nr:dihydrofolate reductase family protein [Bacteroidota bacterium]